MFLIDIDDLIKFTKVPVVNDVAVVVTVLSVLDDGVVNVVGELVLSVTRTHMHLHYSGCCYCLRIIQIKNDNREWSHSA